MKGLGQSLKNRHSRQRDDRQAQVGKGDQARKNRYPAYSRPWKAWARPLSKSPPFSLLPYVTLPSFDVSFHLWDQWTQQKRCRGRCGERSGAPEFPALLHTSAARTSVGRTAAPPCLCRTSCLQTHGMGLRGRRSPETICRSTFAGSLWNWGETVPRSNPASTALRMEILRPPSAAGPHVFQGSDPNQGPRYARPTATF